VHQRPANKIEYAICRMQDAYLEMPELDLTLDEAVGFWNLDRSTCLALLEVLVDFGFLARSPGGGYARSAGGPSGELAEIVRQTAHSRPS